MWIGVIDKSSTINIIGAGISGLLAGFYLKKQGCSVELWDTASSTGGKISSNITSLGLVESAANAIILDNHVLTLLQDLHMSYLPARPKLKRWIQDKDKPISSSAFALSFLKRFALKGIKKTPHTKNYLHTTLSDFFIPLLGYEVSTQIFSAVTRGIYAKNADELTLDAFFSPNFLSTLPANKLS